MFRDLFPSRLSIVALAGCAALIPLCLGLAWSAGVAAHDRNRAEQKAAAFDRQIHDPATGYIVRLSTCQGSLKGAEASVKTQNAAVAALRSHGLAAEARAAEAVRAAQAETRAASRRAQTVLQARPNPGESQCEAAFRLHRENLQ